MHKGAYPTRIIISVDVHSSEPSIPTGDIEEIMKEVKEHFKKPNVVCASFV